MSLWLPKIFSDNMVLQREKSICIWGKAKKASQVKIYLNEMEYSIYSDLYGNWKTMLEPIPVGGPYELIVQSGGEEKIINNILSGEVWFCSGQSNIEFTVSQMDGSDEVLRYSDIPMLRLFNTRQNYSDVRQDDVEQTFWECSKLESAQSFSAIGFVFGKLLTERLNVPVGIIVSAVGATSIQSWISRDAFRKNSILEEDYRISETIEEEPIRKPSALYNGMVSGLQPYTIKGLLWYQGERNANRYDPSCYGRLMEAFIADLRNRFKNQKLPFLFVQLPAYDAGDKDWACLRDEQLMVSKKIPDTGMVVSIDLGDRFDIHPKAKYPVAERLFRMAMSKVYGLDTFEGFPEIIKSIIQKDKIYLEFDNVGMGLVSSDPNDVKGFEACGYDGMFVQMSGRIVGKNRVEFLSSYPINTIRYAWKNWIVPDLFNSEGLPASPFVYMLTSMNIDKEKVWQSNKSLKWMPTGFNS